MNIVYDSKFDIIYIDWVDVPTYGYSEYLDKNVYLRCDMSSDDPIGLHIEDFVKKLDDETKKSLLEKLLHEDYLRFCAKEKLKEFDNGDN